MHTATQLIHLMFNQLFPFLMSHVSTALSFGQDSDAPVSLRQKLQLQALQLCTWGLQAELARTVSDPLLSLPCAGELARREGARDASSFSLS